MQFPVHLTFVIIFLGSDPLLFQPVFVFKLFGLSVPFISNLLLLVIPLLLQFVEALAFFQIQVFQFSVDFLQFQLKCLTVFIQDSNVCIPFFFLFLFPKFNVQHVLLVLLFQFFQFILLHTDDVFLLLDARLVFGFQLLLKQILVCLQVLQLRCDFFHTSAMAFLLSLVVIDGLDRPFDDR